MHGMTYPNGVPHVWGRPATRDDEPPLLDCFGPWRCPHCGAHLTAGPAPICLNAGLADGALIDAVRDAPTTAAAYMQELRAALIECRSALQRVKPQARGALVVQDIDYALKRSMRAMLGTELGRLSTEMRRRQ